MTIEELEKSVKDTVEMAVCNACDYSRCDYCKKIERYYGYIETAFQKYKDEIFI